MIEIDGQLINVNKIHYVRRESDAQLLISFGPDFIRFKKSPKELERIVRILKTSNNTCSFDDEP
jgi:hypothetical protein